VSDNSRGSGRAAATCVFELRARKPGISGTGRDAGLILIGSLHYGIMVRPRGLQRCPSSSEGAEVVPSPVTRSRIAQMTDARRQRTVQENCLVACSPCSRPPPFVGEAVGPILDLWRLRVRYLPRINRNANADVTSGFRPLRASSKPLCS